MQRRDFVKTCSAGLGLATILSDPASVYSTPVNNRVNLAVIGCGSRSDWLVRDLINRTENDVRFLYAVDAQQSRAENRAKQASKEDVPAKAIQDAKVVFDDPNVDGVVLATPDHWHALHTIQACEAGKDVYVEKPVARSPFEGEQMIRAAQKWNRIVQVGTQTRSAAYCFEAKKFIEEGNLGEIEFCRIHNMWPQRGPDSIQIEAVPKDLNWDVWLGPSLYRDFSPTYMQGLQWEWFWGLGSGILGVQGIHQIDMARWMLGVQYPKSVYAAGKLHKPEGTNGRETPESISATYDFDKFIVNVEQTTGKPYMLETDFFVRENDLFPYWYQNATRVEIYGTKFLMVIGRLGAGWQVFDRTKNRLPVVKKEMYGRYPHVPHLANFVDCIRSRQKPNAPIEEGQCSTMMVHYANMSWRLGQIKLEIDPATGHITNCPDAAPLWKPEFRKEYDIPTIE